LLSCSTWQAGSEKKGRFSLLLVTLTVFPSVFRLSVWGAFFFEPLKKTLFQAGF
jgi:hypothetical protein